MSMPQTGRAIPPLGSNQPHCRGEVLDMSLSYPSYCVVEEKMSLKKKTHMCLPIWNKQTLQLQRQLKQGKNNSGLNVPNLPSLGPLQLAKKES